MRSFFLGFILLHILPLVICGQDCPQINFSNYLNFSFDPSSCKYTTDGISMQLFNIYNFQQPIVCNQSDVQHTIYQLKIDREDIPINSGRNINIFRSFGGCVSLRFELEYNDGSKVKEFGESIIVQNFENLKFITITEGECGLYVQGLPPVLLNFVEVHEGAEPPTNDSDIGVLETLLADPANENRRDFHRYDIEATICEFDSYEGRFNCSVSSAFDIMKSKQEYQAPIPVDFPNLLSSLSSVGCISLDIESDIPTNPYDFISKSFSDSEVNSEEGLQANQIINLEGNSMRITAGIFSKLFNDESCIDVIDFSNDPIKIVIDEENKCITNYTLPGHILYPGKVERCIVSEDCGSIIKIVTKGIGFHYCGDTELGAFFACMNKDIGNEAFRKVNERLITAFNQ